LSVVFYALTVAATAESPPLSLHDALPISYRVIGGVDQSIEVKVGRQARLDGEGPVGQQGGSIPLHPPVEQRQGGELKSPRESGRSEEHTSELQSRENLVCRLLLEKNNNTP